MRSFVRVCVFFVGFTAKPILKVILKDTLKCKAVRKIVNFFLNESQYSQWTLKYAEQKRIKLN